MEWGIRSKLRAVADGGRRSVRENWAMLGTTKKGMAQASVWYAVKGFLLLGGGVLSLVAACLPLIADSGYRPLPPVVMLFLWLSMLGVGIVSSAAGIVLLVRSFSARHFRAPLTAEQAMMGFVKGLFGGALIPANPALAFLCLAPGAQTRLGDWRALKKAVRLFILSEKQKHNVTSLDLNIGRAEVLACSDDGSVAGTVYLGVAFGGGAEGEMKTCLQRIEFSLVESAGRWYVTDFRGGPSEFLGKEVAPDSSSHRAGAEMKTAGLLIGSGLFTLAIAAGSIVLGLVMPKGDTAFVFVFVVPFFLGIVALALLGNGLGLRSKYR